jgi:hypothetical protein
MPWKIEIKKMKILIFDIWNEKFWHLKIFIFEIWNAIFCSKFDFFYHITGGKWKKIEMKKLYISFMSPR